MAVLGSTTLTGVSTLSGTTNTTTSLGLTNVASAVNNISITNSIAGTGPTLSVVGSDTNISLTLTAKGTGTVNAPTFNATSGGFQGIDDDLATTPSFTWSGDLDTGMYRVGTDSIGFTVGGVNRVTIDGNTVSFVDTLSDYNTSVSSHFIDYNLTGSTALTANRTQRGLFVDLDHTATGGTTTSGTRETLFGVQSDIDTSGTPYTAYGISGQVRSYNTTGTISAIVGTRGYAEGDSGTGGTTTSVYGIQGEARDGGAGTVSSVYGGQFYVVKQLEATATLPTATAMRAEVEINANTITTTKAGEFIIDIDGGTLTNAYLTYGAYEGTIQAGCWNLYYPSDAPSFINGELRLGATTDLGSEKLQVTGNVRATGSISGNTLISTVATGTAPLTVASTTLVTNLNADLLDGKSLVDSAATGNTVVGRTSNGDIHARLIRQDYANQDIISGGMVFRINNTTDNYLRVCQDKPAIRTFLDVPTRAGLNASGTWGISITGNAATATKLATARTINGVSFDGLVDINIPDLRASNGTVLVDGAGVTSAVNYVSLTNAAASGTVVLSTAGSDTNIPLRFTTKGTGFIEITTAGGQIRLRPGSAGVRFYDDSDTYYYNLATGTLTANRTLTLPNAGVTLVGGTMVPTTGTGATGSWGISVTGSSASCTGNAATATTATNCSRSVEPGNGITGGGALTANRTITLGTPGSLTGSTANAVTTSSHTHAITVNLGVTAGTTAGPVITSSAGTNATIPSASASASGVVTTNAQTFAGTKTFDQVTATSAASSGDRLLIRATNTSWTGRLYSPQLYRSGNGTQNFSVYTSAVATTGDNEFIFTSNGNARADGSWTGGGADYAEFFEWLDGNPNNEDRSGMTVALDEEKIKVSEPGDEVIGVVSTNPVVVGDSAWNFWSQKYLRDAYSRHIYDEHQVIEWTDEDGTLKTYEDWFIPEGVIIPANAIYKTHDEDGNLFTHRRLNPDWDPEQEYIPRVERPEWDPIGLMGKLRIRKGQVVGERWIKMRDISSSVEEWLVR